MSFSLELSEDVIQVRDWVHEFAATVVRPAAAEWDEREETPWPIIQEAAKVGLYSLDFVATMFGDPTGQLLPIVGIVLGVLFTLGTAGANMISKKARCMAGPIRGWVARRRPMPPM